METILNELHLVNEEFSQLDNTTGAIVCLPSTNLSDESLNITKCFTPTSVDVLLSKGVQTFFNVLYCSTSVLALIGNVSVLLVQVRCYRMPPFQNLKKYLINLAISDIVFGVLCVPFTYTDINLGLWPYPASLCPLSQYAQLLSVFVTANTLMIIGIERYSAIVYPFSRFYRLFKSNSYYLVGFVWALGAGFAFIPIQYTNLEKSVMFKKSTVVYYQCSNYIGIRGLDRRIFVLVNFMFTFAIPSIVLACTYVAITRNFYHFDKVLKQENINLSPSRRRTVSQSQNFEIAEPSSYRSRNIAKTIRITSIVFILYCLCWAPIKVFQLLHEFDFISYCTEQQFYTHRYFYMAFHWLAMANSFVNPIVYTFSSQRFRHDLKKMFKPF